ncbi:MAG: radical SAM protein [Streptococcaceae bacterium]|jgi:radical SAM superfamily enzyme YgiQ (UPF0313 family)|nr:radical SAM protein [Streptococcaceae bacterium]
MRNIDVLFVHSRNVGTARDYLKLPSIELTYMSQILHDNNYLDYLIDCNINDIPGGNLEYHCLNLNPKIVLVYGNEHNHLNLMRDIKQIAQLFPNALIGAFGVMVNFMSERLFKQFPELNFIVQKTGDFVPLSILQHNLSLEKVSNIYYRANNKIIKNPFVNYKLEMLPIPNRAIYESSKYLKYTTETIVRSTRGCQSNCAFCNKTVFEKFSKFSMAHFFKEIDLCLSLGYETFFFADDTFAYSQSRVNDFCQYYSEQGYTFKWSSNLRMCDIDDERLETIKKHGGYRVFVGIETISSKSNKLMNKAQNITNIREKIGLIKKCGIELHASFIVGNPGDTIEDIEATSDFIQETLPDIVSFNALKILPGTPIFDNPEKFGIIPEDKYWFENPEWEKKALIGTSTLSTSEIDKYSLKMKKDYYQALILAEE